jgi:DNA-binding response OmpR family regulator
LAKILVVDDDPDIVEAMRLVLEGRNHEVAAAGNASEGEQKTLEFRPDLILLDIMMPEGTEGFQFVWKLRNEMSEEVRGTKILVLSAIHSKVDLRFYIDKPAAPQELLNKVDEVLAAG